MWLRLTWLCTSRPIEAQRSSPTQLLTSVRMASTDEPEGSWPGMVACSPILRIA